MDCITQTRRIRPRRAMWLFAVLGALALCPGCVGWAGGTIDASRVPVCTQCRCTSWWDANGDDLCDNGKYGVSYGEACGHAHADHMGHGR